MRARRQLAIRAQNERNSQTYLGEEGSQFEPDLPDQWNPLLGAGASPRRLTGAVPGVGPGLPAEQPILRLAILLNERSFVRMAESSEDGTPQYPTQLPGAAATVNEVPYAWIESSTLCSNVVHFPDFGFSASGERTDCGWHRCSIGWYWHRCSAGLFLWILRLCALCLRALRLLWVGLLL